MDTLHHRTNQSDTSYQLMYIVILIRFSNSRYDRGEAAASNFAVLFLNFSLCFLGLYILSKIINRASLTVVTTFT